MGLDEYDLIQCDPDDTDGSPECDPLNAELAADSCGRFYCSPTGRGCVFEERRNAEICDGLDNDCDGYLDETAPFGSSERTLDEADVARVSAAAAGDGTLHVLLTRTPGRFEVERRTVLGSEESPGTPAFVAESECTAPPGGPATEPCNIDQLALAAANNVVVAAGVHRGGCGAGQLRLGAASPSDALPMGDDPAARVSFGIDVDESNQRACSSSAGCDGARDPALALWGPERARASEGALLWRVPGDAACSAEQTLAGLMFSIEPARATFSRLRVGPTSTGFSAAPVVGSPVVAAIGSAGYVVAFPSTDHVRVLLLPLLAQSEAIEVIDETQIAANGVHGCTIATGEADPSGFAIAYRTRTSEGDAIGFSSFTLQGDEAPIKLRKALRSFRVAGEVVDGPSLTYLPSGFGSASLSQLEGGYLLLWVEQPERSQDDERRLMAVRVAEHDLRVLNEPFVLAEGRIHQVFTYPKQSVGDVAHAYGYRTDRAIHLGSLSCKSRE
jgi:hypothetical protein